MSSLRPLRLKTGDAGFEKQITQLLAWDETDEAGLAEQVKGIIDAVRAAGDQALLDYTRRFDRRTLASAAELEVTKAQISRAQARVSDAQTRALTVAAERIRRYHQHQRQESWQFEDDHGSVLGQRITALQRVGIYVPGGKASYPSSVLMNAIPAAVAGVEEVVMTVPAPAGELNPLVLVAAELAGVTRIFTVGGAQAIAALAFGTETMPKVDKIVGPGNRYVAAAKRAVFGRVGLDMVAGPSEILIIGDSSCPPDWLAMDLFAQAEHDEAAQALLISPDSAHLDAVLASMERLLPDMARREIIAEAINRRGALIQVGSLDEAIELTNRIAPEHLQLAVADAQSLLPRIRNAGAIFLGMHTPEALGDYCAGANHVLPTSATARFSSPLGVYDFQKRTSVIACTAEGAAALAETASVLARSESLTAHARSAEYRLKKATD